MTTIPQLMGLGISAAQAIAIVDASIKSITAGATVDSTYDGAIIIYSGSGAITLTFPANLTLGFNCAVYQLGTGQVTCTGSGGATVRNRQSFTKTAGQWAAIGIVYLTANNFVLAGDGA